MKTSRTAKLLLAGLLTVAAAVFGSAQASAATLTVCPSGCAFTQIAPAVAAAKSGDTIAIAAGTYTGGFTINVSVKLVGAGPGRTIISGGGPVLTIGQIFAASEPTVSINGVTITGGVTRSSPESTPFKGKEGVWAAGGGIEVPPNADFSGGATVAISNSVITGNRVAPSDTVSSDGPCPGGTCAFAWAFGGGIDTSGSLTLGNTTVSDNRIGGASGLSGLATFAEGAGIFSARGDLTITNSTISGNQAAASPNGLIADAGGISSDGTFAMSNSSVTDNSASVNGALFFGFVPSGGIHIQQDGQPATISSSTISGNAAMVTNSLGGAFAFSGGLHIDTNGATLSKDVIANNSVSSMALPGSTGDAVAGSGAGEINGTLSNVRLTGNTVDANSAAGNANAEAGATVFDGGTITNGLISDNHVHASAPIGSVLVRGGSIFVAVSLTLRNSTMSGNTVDASGANGSALGGGIFDVAFPDGDNGPPGGPLALTNSNVTGNTLSGSAGVTLQGGGIFLQNEPITLTHSLISQNAPDQCFGC
jgi:hypothetical protein